MSSKKQVGVIFGSRSCEREVSIISAVQLMHHVDTEKYGLVPVYIDENGNWYFDMPRGGGISLYAVTEPAT